MVYYLVGERGANIEVKTDKGETPLHFACESGDLNLVKYLLEEKGANQESKNNDGFGPLFYACSEGHLSINFTNCFGNNNCLSLTTSLMGIFF